MIGILSMSSNSYAQRSAGKLCIKFQNFIGDAILTEDSLMYKNAFGQLYSINSFKYYISNVQLLKTDKTYTEAQGYFLINEDEQESKNIELQIPKGDYKGIRFVLGVDSLHNCSGAQSGALDPVNGMFWAWNSGYIFLKLEGKSPYSSAPGKIFEYHIGGYKNPANSIRIIELPFEAINLSNEYKSVVQIKTDISEILKRPTDIDFAKLPSITDTRNSSVIADNYSDMFSILSIQK